MRPTSPNPLSVSFALPSAGWIGITLTCGQERFTDNFSYVYPSLTRLCSSLCDLLNRMPTRPVTFLFEPAELDVYLTSAGQAASATFSLFPSRDRTAEPQRTFQCLSDRVILVTTFWRALRRLQTALPPDKFALEFQRPFPSADMESLTNLLQRHKSAG